MALSPNKYYILFNPTLKDEAGIQYALHAGIYLKPFGVVGIAPMSLSSQNWQLFPQGGRWFIRNYDYGPDYQLGLTTQGGGVPTLLRRSGSLGQQWSITPTDGGYRLTNGLLGNGTALAVPSQVVDIAMQAASVGTIWNITANQGDGPGPAEFYDEVKDFEVSTSSSSLSSSAIRSSTSSSLESSTASGSQLFSTSTSPSNSPNSNTSISPSGSSSSALGAGAIAGIVIGAVAVLAFIIFGFWFMARKRKSAANAHELDGNYEHSEKYAYRAELNAPRQVWESDSRERHAEMP